MADDPRMAEDAQEVERLKRRLRKKLRQIENLALLERELNWEELDKVPNLPCFSGNVYCLNTNVIFFYYIFILLISFLPTEKGFGTGSTNQLKIYQSLYEYLESR